ncbi:MAG TPA: asparaginase [Bacillota bacterium]|nr:asparaginase [Bacillota bacterium]
MNHTTKPIQVYRGNVVESTHDVHIAVVTVDGNLIAYYGDAHRLIFARSAMKPFQALPVVESGAMEAFNLTEKQLSLFCASHSGEPFHREQVLDVLQKINLAENDLQCGTHMPKDEASYKQLLREGKGLTPVYSNCSGKHAGMLAGCVQQHFDIATYRDINHPYQQQIIEVIADISGYKKDNIETSIDGCGVPVHRIPLARVALLFARLAAPDAWREGKEKRKRSLKRIRNAMTAYPEMVAGTKRLDTDLMKAYGGRIVAKGGAEGVHCFGDSKTGIGVALKIADGNARGTQVASMEVLKQLHIGDESIWNELFDYHYPPILNMRDERIGEIRSNFTLHRL